MSRSADRNSRRQRREKRKLEDARSRRQQVEPFIATCRSLARAGWLRGPFLDCLETDAEPELWRRTAFELCALSDTRPGESESWSLLFRVVEDAQAPESIRSALLAKWIRLAPEDPAPYVARIYGLLRDDKIEDAARAASEAYSGPAGEQIDDHLRNLRDADGERMIRFFRRLCAMAVDSREQPSYSPPPLSNPRAPRRSSDRDRRGRRHRAESALDTDTGPAGRFEAGTRSPAGPPQSAPPLATALARIQATATRLPDGASLTFEPWAADDVAVRLCTGPHDDLWSIDLASTGLDILAVDHFDRLLCVPSLQGVEHLRYQLDTVSRVLKRFRGRVLLADEVGLGKTIEACMILKEYLLRGQVKRTLILVPPSMVGQWRAELEEKFGVRSRTTQDPELRVDPRTFWEGPGVVVASLASARSAAHREAVLAKSFDLVIVDEAHHLKNRKTRAWELVNQLRSRFCLMLTATPVETDLTELYNLVTLLRPGTLGTMDEFRQRFMNPRDATRPRDSETLRQLLREVMIRNTRALCGVRLPPRIARTIVVEPTREEKELYDLLVAATRRHGAEHRTLFRLLLEEAGSSPLAVATTAARSVGSARHSTEVERDLQAIERVARSVSSTAKLDRFLSLLDGEKVLVFSRFRATMEQIGRELVDRDIPFDWFHGGLTGEEKDRAVRSFAGPDRRVLLCSEIGGEGRNLQFCHRLINFDLPWNPMVIEQRIGRVHRIGQTETVEVTNLAAVGTAEDRILDVLDRRVHLFELVIGEMDLVLGDVTGEKDFGDHVFDIYASSRTDEEVQTGFDRLADRLLEGRGRLEKTKALDETLFGEDYEA